MQEDHSVYSAVNHEMYGPLPPLLTFKEGGLSQGLSARDAERDLRSFLTSPFFFFWRTSYISMSASMFTSTAYSFV